MKYGIVYRWVCVTTGKSYVGQTINTLSGRWKGHVKSAFDLNSKSSHWEFPKAIREYGKESFIGTVLCECESAEELSMMEDFWMHKLDTLWPNGYNMRDGTNFVCEKVRKLISERTKEAMAKTELREKLSILAKERCHDVQVAAMKKAWTGSKHTEETRQLLKGRVLSQEHREKLSQALKGKPKSEEHCRKLSQALKGKKKRKK